MLVRVLGSYLHEIIIIVNRLVYIPRLQRQCTQTINHLPAPLSPVIRNIQNIIALLILPVLLVDITDICQHRHIPHSLPVNCVSNLSRFVIRAVFHKFKHLFCL